MADYPRSDALRELRRQHEALRRLRTQRPRRAHVKSMTWAMEGQINNDRYFTPALVTIDPVSGHYPEFKRVVALDGWLSVGGPVVVDWVHNNGTFYSGHSISGGSNRIVLPTPYVIENHPGALGFDFKGQFLQPQITDPGAVGGAFVSYHLSCIAIIETVPI